MFEWVAHYLRKSEGGRYDMSLKDLIGNMGSFFGLEDSEEPHEVGQQIQHKQPNTRSFQKVPPTPKKQNMVTNPAQAQRVPSREPQRTSRVEPTQQRPQQTPTPAPKRKQQAVEKKIVSMSAERKTTRMGETASNSASTIMVLEPRVYSEAMKIAKHVMSGKSVLVNFHLMEEHQARRVVDFLTGTVYAEDGDIKRVSDEMFLCTPKTVEIEGAAKSLVQNEMFDLSEMSL